MNKLKIFLKSGHTVILKCDEWKFTINNVTLEYTGYSFNGLKNVDAISFEPSQIAGYIVLKHRFLKSK